MCAFQPRGRCGTGGLHALSRTCLLIPIGSMNNNTLSLDHDKFLPHLWDSVIPFLKGASLAPEISSLGW